MIEPPYSSEKESAHSIFFALIGLVILSWVVTLLRHILDLLDEWREDRVMARLLACRVRQARANGQSAVSVEGLF